MKKEDMKIFIIIAVLLMLSIYCIADETHPEGEPDTQISGFRNNREPSVTRAEAELIDKAFSIYDKNPEQAVRLLVSNTDDKSSEALDYSLAGFYFAQENHDEAEKYYLSELEKNPLYNRAHDDLARLYIAREEYDKATEQFQKVISSGFMDYSLYTLMGYHYLLKDRPVSAENSYRQAMLIDSDDITARSGLARSLLMQGRYRECISLIDEVLYEQPESRDFWFVLADCHRSLGQYREALEVLETARSLGHINRQSVIMLAELYLYNEQPEFAVQYYKTAFSEYEVETDPLLRAARGLSESGSPELGYELLQKFKKAIEEKDRTDEVPIIEASYFMERGELERAGKICTDALSEYPVSSGLLLLSGDISLRQGKHEKALIAYERAERVMDDKSISFIRRAMVEVDRERYDVAVDLLENAQRLNPRSHISSYLEQVRRFVM